MSNTWRPYRFVHLALCSIVFLSISCDNASEEAKRIGKQTGANKAVEQASAELDRASHQLAQVREQTEKALASTAEDLTKSVSATASGVADAVSTHTSTVTDHAAAWASSAGQMASDEFEKQFALEYRVATVARNAGAESLEKTLVELGKERWDCFNVRKQGEQLVILCKRRPRSYIDYLQHLPLMARLF